MIKMKVGLFTVAIASVLIGQSAGVKLLTDSSAVSKNATEASENSFSKVEVKLILEGQSTFD